MSLLVERQLVARDLQRLRLRAGLSTYQLAKQLGISQSKVSKLENGRVSASLDNVRAWALATGATAEQVPDLLRHAEAALTEAIAWRGSIPEGALSALQSDVAALEEKATAISVYHPCVIPGLLQTAAYARQVFLAHVPVDESAIASAVAARIDRQRILYNASKKFEFVVPESVFYWAPTTGALMLDQIDRILNVMTLENVDVGVVPLRGAVWTWHSHGFNYFRDVGGGEDLVHVETLTAALNVSELEDVTMFRDVFAGLWASAQHGREAVEILQRTRKELT
ncbi:MAG: helix-turn-helix domain-containing protein [Candidatus Dormibacteraceae bacterium]